MCAFVWGCVSVCVREREALKLVLSDFKQLNDKVIFFKANLNITLEYYF